MYCRHFQSSIRKCQEEERKGRTAEISFFVQEKMQEHHNSLEQTSSWTSSLAEGLLGGVGRHTFRHLPPLCSPAWLPVRIKSSFIPTSFGPRSSRCPEQAGLEALLSIFRCSPPASQSGHSLKMGVEGLFKKPNSTPRAPARQQVLCTCLIISVK